MCQTDPTHLPFEPDSVLGAGNQERRHVSNVIFNLIIHNII